MWGVALIEPQFPLPVEKSCFPHQPCCPRQLCAHHYTSRFSNSNKQTHARTHTYAHKKHIHTHTHTHARVRTHTYTHTNTHTHTHTHTHIQTHTHINTHTDTHRRAHAPRTHKYTHTLLCAIRLDAFLMKVSALTGSSSSKNSIAILMFIWSLYKGSMLRMPASRGRIRIISASCTTTRT